MTRVCRNGHEPYDFTSRSLCPECVRLQNKRYREKHRESLSLKAKALLATEEGKARRNGSYRKSKEKMRAEGRRDYCKEYADRIGMTLDEYRRHKEQRLIDRQERLRLKIIIAEPKQEAHVKAYLSSPEYSRRRSANKYNNNKESERYRCMLLKRDARKRITDWYVATCFGTTLAKLPVPLITLGRQIIISRRFLNELKQCGSSKTNAGRTA